MWQPLNSSTSPSTSLSTRPRCMTSASRVTASRGTHRWKTMIFEDLGKIWNPFRPTSSTWLGGTSRWKKNLNSIPDSNLLNLLIILPWKYVPTIKCYFFKGSLASVHCALGPCQEEGAPNMEGKVLLQMCISNWFLFPQAKLKQQEEVPSLQEGIVRKVFKLAPISYLSHHLWDQW